MRINAFRRIPLSILALVLVVVGATPLLLNTLRSEAVASSGPTVVATVPIAGGAENVAVNPNTNRIYVLGCTGLVSVLDGTTNEILDTVSLPNLSCLWWRGIAVNPNTNLVYVAYTGSSAVIVIDGQTNEIVETIETGSFLVDVAINPVTSQIYVASMGDHSVFVIDGASHAVVADIPTGFFDGPNHVVVNPNTNRIYALVSGNDSVAVIDGATNTETERVYFPHTYPINLGINPATNRVYVATYGEGTYIVDGNTNAVVDAILICPQDIEANPITNRIYAAGYDQIGVVDGETGVLVALVDAYSDWDLAVNPNTNRIYSASRGFLSVIEDLPPYPPAPTRTPTPVPTTGPSPTPTATPSARVHVDPVSQQAREGTPVAVHVVVDGAENLGAYEFVLRFDPAVLEFVSAENGPFLGSTGRTVDCLPPVVEDTRIENDPRQYRRLRMGCGSESWEPAGPDGTGVLASVAFMPVGGGVSDLDIQAAHLTDPLVIFPIVPVLEDGSVTVSQSSTPTPAPTATRTPRVTPSGVGGSVSLPPSADESNGASDRSIAIAATALLSAAFVAGAWYTGRRFLRRHQ